eukprot:CAMPEP_0178426484 /NCGR_PEP_ID=MMETSP0689_2-20121128/29258_1 /TAXON_ID=160604 /ORGANISM="Amphidinium massartii, Strain CS-259" /LENGTH=324 /DNA_ID=CAMNT_0020048171 /DNA_START=61 /DNA_END=1032 /DNA_ORIENTATION=+
MFGNSASMLEAERKLGMPMKVRYDQPNTIATVKDASLPPEKLLEVDTAQVQAGKNNQLMKPLKLRFLEDGPDRTVDATTEFKKNLSLEGVWAQQTILDLRETIADDENIAIEDVNLYLGDSLIPDHIRIGYCMAEYMGFGVEEWPPKFIVKPRIKGFEVQVVMPACRDTSVWDGGRLANYSDKKMTFDLELGTTVLELKELITKRLKIPPARQILTAHMRRNARSWGEFVDLSDDKKTMADYSLAELCVRIALSKSNFDANGNYVFDDAYHDEQGYHPPPLESWIPLDSLADRSRPDAQKVDPNQPATMIVSDRWAAGLGDKGL